MESKHKKISRGDTPRLIFLCPVPTGSPHRSHCVPMNINPCDSKVFHAWRGREDLNLRDAFYTSYSLSRGAPSASWVLPQVDGKFSWRREWDSNPRMLSHRRFSRPVPSTARPSLRVVSPRLSLKRGLYHTIPRRCLSTVPREFFAFSRISAQRRRVWRMMR